MDFQPFKSIPRLYRECTVQEKIDGTNAVIHIENDDGTGLVLAGSRSRWITPEADNFGFAKWVKAHEDELRSLGGGFHYGEWWGPGIQRGYGVREKTFSLFNVSHWGIGGKHEAQKPACCSVVPVLAAGVFSEDLIQIALEILETKGSQASPGFMRPEGIVVFHEKAQTLFKWTFGGDGHKGEGV